MREECMEPTFIANDIRITPAHAGRISSFSNKSIWARDHPRACGKNWDYIQPRKYIKWITPAHAGRIGLYIRHRMSPGDHPRACGKNINLSKERNMPEGSPPRMREECHRTEFYAADTWITPAHAGRIIIVFSFS